MAPKRKCLDEYNNVSDVITLVDYSDGGHDERARVKRVKLHDTSTTSNDYPNAELQVQTGDPAYWNDPDDSEIRVPRIHATRLRRETTFAKDRKATTPTRKQSVQNQKSVSGMKQELSGSECPKRSQETGLPIFDRNIKLSAALNTGDASTKIKTLNVESSKLAGAKTTTQGKVQLENYPGAYAAYGKVYVFTDAEEADAIDTINEGNSSRTCKESSCQNRSNENFNSRDTLADFGMINLLRPRGQSDVMPNVFRLNGLLNGSEHLPPPSLHEREIISTLLKKRPGRHDKPNTSKTSQMKGQNFTSCPRQSKVENSRDAEDESKSASLDNDPVGSSVDIKRKWRDKDSDHVIIKSTQNSQKNHYSSKRRKFHHDWKDPDSMKMLESSRAMGSTAGRLLDEDIAAATSIESRVFVQNEQDSGVFQQLPGGSNNISNQQHSETIAYAPVLGFTGSKHAFTSAESVDECLLQTCTRQGHGREDPSADVLGPRSSSGSVGNTCWSPDASLSTNNPVGQDSVLQSTKDCSVASLGLTGVDSSFASPSHEISHTGEEHNQEFRPATPRIIGADRYILFDATKNTATVEKTQCDILPESDDDLKDEELIFIVDSETPPEKFTREQLDLKFSKLRKLSDMERSLQEPEFVHFWPNIVQDALEKASWISENMDKEIPFIPGDPHLQLQHPGRCRNETGKAFREGTRCGDPSCTFAHQTPALLFRDMDTWLDSSQNCPDDLDCTDIECDRKHSSPAGLSPEALEYWRLNSGERAHRIKNFKKPKEIIMCGFQKSCRNPQCFGAHRSPAAPIDCKIESLKICRYGQTCGDGDCRMNHPSPASRNPPAVRWRQVPTPTTPLNPALLVPQRYQGKSASPVIAPEQPYQGSRATPKVITWSPPPPNAPRAPRGNFRSATLEQQNSPTVTPGEHLANINYRQFERQNPVRLSPDHRRGSTSAGSQTQEATFRPKAQASRGPQPRIKETPRDLQARRHVLTQYKPHHSQTPPLGNGSASVDSSPASQESATGYKVEARQVLNPTGLDKSLSTLQYQTKIAVQDLVERRSVQPPNDLLTSLRNCKARLSRAEQHHVKQSAWEKSTMRDLYDRIRTAARKVFVSHDPSWADSLSAGFCDLAEMVDGAHSMRWREFQQLQKEMQDY